MKTTVKPRFARPCVAAAMLAFCLAFGSQAVRAEDSDSLAVPGQDMVLVPAKTVSELQQRVIYLKRTSRSHRILAAHQHPSALRLRTTAAPRPASASRSSTLSWFSSPKPRSTSPRSRTRSARRNRLPRRPRPPREAVAEVRANGPPLRARSHHRPTAVVEKNSAPDQVNDVAEASGMARQSGKADHPGGRRARGKLAVGSGLRHHRNGEAGGP